MELEKKKIAPSPSQTPRDAPRNSARQCTCVADYTLTPAERADRRMETIKVKFEARPRTFFRQFLGRCDLSHLTVVRAFTLTRLFHQNQPVAQRTTGDVHA